MEGSKERKKIRNSLDKIIHYLDKHTFDAKNTDQQFHKERKMKAKEEDNGREVEEQK